MEHFVLGLDHAELGGELMRRWNLPPDVVAAVSHHHQLERAAPYEQLTAVVQVGDRIAHHLSTPNLAQADFGTPSANALEVVRLGPGDLPGLLEKTRVEMEKVKGIFEI
jgi:HD-like signal output (HDOD) protein